MAALPLIEGFEYLPVGLNNGVVIGTALQNRGIQTHSDTTLTSNQFGCEVIDGYTYLRSRRDYDVRYFWLYGEVPTMWFGVRLASSVGTTRTYGYRISTSAGIYYIRLMNDNSISVYRAASQSCLLGGYGNGVFVEIEFTGTTVNVYVNGSATPDATWSDTVTGFNYTGSAGTGDANGCSVGCIYASKTRLNDGRAVLRPLTVISNTGTPLGTATTPEEVYDGNFVSTKSIRYMAGENTVLAVADITDHPISIPAVNVIVCGKKTGTVNKVEKCTLNTATDNDLYFPALSVSNNGRRIGLSVDPADDEPFDKTRFNAMTITVGSE